jgi:GNAT superfamily N-acetyltransferase
VTVRFELLHRGHDRAGFACGVAPLDDWFRTRAAQDQRRHVAQVFVALDERGIVGFYSLSMFSLVLDSVPEDLRRKLPRYDAIPAALIGRLARAQRAKGSGLGDLLLADATKRVLAATSSLAAYAIVVDAKDEPARRFYESHGFVPLPSRPSRLFLLTETAAQALKAAVAADPRRRARYRAPATACGASSRTMRSAP